MTVGQNVLRLMPAPPLYATFLLSLSSRRPGAHYFALLFSIHSRMQRGNQASDVAVTQRDTPKDCLNALSITFSYFNHIPLANNVNCLSFTVCHQSQQLSNAFSHQPNCWCQLLVKRCAALQLQGTSAPCWELLVYVNGREWLFTVELGVLVPYPDEGKDAKDHRRPSALQRKQMSLKSPVLSIHVVQKNPDHNILNTL